MIPSDLYNLVSTTIGKGAADELREYSLTESEKELLKTAVHEVMLLIKPVPGACLMMSALLYFRLSEIGNAPTYVVAGGLLANGEYVYGLPNMTIDDRAFSKSSVNWDGHAWVQHGQYIVDVAMLRTVAAGKAPKILADHVRARWGTGTGALCADDIAMQEDGLIYRPLRVLTQSEVDPLINGALSGFVDRK